MSKSQRTKHTTGGIPRWSPTLVLVARFSAYVWQSGRDAQFSLTYGRMYQRFELDIYCSNILKQYSILVEWGNIQQLQRLIHHSIIEILP